MKNALFVLVAFILQNTLLAQTKAVPPFEREQYVRNIIQELDIPDDIFEQMRGKDYIVPLKLFINEKGKVVRVSIPNDDYKLEPLITPVVVSLPDFQPAIIDGIAKSSMVNLPFLLNECTCYKLVRQPAEPAVGDEKFIKKLKSNFYLTDRERANLDITSTYGDFPVAVTFIVEKDGSLSCFTMLDEEMNYLKKRMENAVRKASKKWIPGKYNGQNVRSKFTFTLTLQTDFRF